MYACMHVCVYVCMAYPEMHKFPAPAFIEKTPNLKYNSNTKIKPKWDKQS